MLSSAAICNECTPSSLICNIPSTLEMILSAGRGTKKRVRKQKERILGLLRAEHIEASRGREHEMREENVTDILMRCSFKVVSEVAE